MEGNFSPAEESHIRAFALARPKWRFAALSERLYDEDTGSREHKYARTHPYVAGLRYVMPRIVETAPCRVLDIGSPLIQNVALACLPGVDVTVLDIRPNDDHDALGLTWLTASATKLPFEDRSWDLVTSLWVMGHVGDGRYGDDFDVDGDRKMIAEIARVLRPGGQAIIGPGLIDEECGNIFNVHRVYSWEWLKEEFEREGLEVLETIDLPVSDDVFFRAGSYELERRDGRYGLAWLKKR